MNLMDDPVVPVSLDLTLSRMPDTAIEKFSGYQYGGRPLGLSFVKYQTPGGAGDAMDTEVTHLTQDQIM
ncbi:hypothetical protein EYC84_008905 [Monilinia fructicola]|uniref:Uncharacterized protein n=1 Tax=Monilinia fructicola TaxID=38448 RepID=A0A5M9JD71_MONFR|nr:hypothetical protein EYC84_008905 [Monilinia fructicola]